MNYKQRYAYGNGFVVLAVGLDMFRLAAIVTGGKMKSTDNVSFTKRTSVVWMPGSWTQRDRIAFAEGLCERGRGIILAEGLNYCWRRAVLLFFQLYPDICLKKPKLV
jgi:hypothetical protein